MRKNVFGRRFKRDKNERKALFKGLLSALVLRERIKTTEPKAKAIKGDADKIVTKAKKNGDLAKRMLGDILNSQALEKLVNDIAPRFKNRNGGYTRIIRIGKRFGDNAMEVVMEWTEKGNALVEVKSQKSKVKNKSSKVKAGKKISRAKTSRTEIKQKSAKGPSQKRKKTT